jgi:hypothetical protein
MNSDREFLFSKPLHDDLIIFMNEINNQISRKLPNWYGYFVAFMV